MMHDLELDQAIMDLDSVMKEAQSIMSIGNSGEIVEQARRNYLISFAVLTLIERLLSEQAA
jgi:hypothetical protein